VLPIEFFYLESLPAFFGGLVVYYLGIYGYGASVTEPGERAHRIARLDGTETLATMLGTLLSPVIAKRLGYLGNYGIMCGSALLAGIYLKIRVKEPVRTAPVASEKSPINPKTKESGLVRTFLVTPLLDMKSLLAKKRSALMTALIVIQEPIA
jgi:predicted MFS family arabinose efflux permease